jgi:hypothetical protein
MKPLLGKVRKMLSHYANSKDTLLEELAILDVCGPIKGLQQDLIDFAEIFYQVKSTRQSQLCIVRRLIKSISTSSDIKRECPEEISFVEDNLPDYMKSIWTLLPRKGGGGLANPKKRLQLPLSSISISILKVLLAVNSEQEIDSLNDLLVNHHLSIIKKIKSTVLPKTRTQLYHALSKLTKLSGLKLKRPRPSITLEQIPPKLREQIEIFKELAPKGLINIPYLSNEAAKWIKARQMQALDESTVRQYEKVLLYGFAYIEFQGDVGVEHLLQIREVTREVSGRTFLDIHNPYVDQYREIERARSSAHKQTKFDSIQFMTFLDALKAVAKFSGYFELLAPFNKAYRTNSDQNTKKDRKKKKKTVMTRPWIKANIEDLKRRFDRIIRTQSFKYVLEDLEVCLFLPQLVTLRYLGFRQQCARNCERGTHIIFNADGSITFRWEEGEIKNEKAIDTTISLEDHGDIPELVLLLEVLSNYHSKVLIPLQEMDADCYRKDIGNSFFGYLSANGTLTGFGRDDASTYARYFSQTAYKFLNFDSLLYKDVDFNPHFLRAVCCDWMRKDLKMRWADISKALGDTEQTLKGDYFEEEKLWSATDPFAGVSKAMALEKKAKKAQENEKRGISKKELDAVLGELVALREDLQSMRELLKSEREDNRRKDELISELTGQLQLQSQQQAYNKNLAVAGAT